MNVLSHTLISSQSRFDERVWVGGKIEECSNDIYISYTKLYTCMYTFVIVVRSPSTKLCIPEICIPQPVLPKLLPRQGHGLYFLRF